MKKSFRTLTLGLLTIGMLAACNPPAPAPNWSSDDQKTMSDNLYGVVLPYVSLGNLEVKYDPAQEQVVVTGDELESTAIASYAQKFTTADGWTDITPANAAYYSFEKQVNNEAGAKRWVAVQFSNEEYTPASTDGETGPSQSVANEGEGEAAAKAKRFAIYAADPYLYDQALVISTLQQDIYDMCHITEQPIPNFPAERYVASLDPTGNYANTFFFYTDDQAPAQYKAALEAAPYNYHVKVDQTTGIYTANTDTENFVLKFQYDADEGQTALWAGNFVDWPSISIANLLKGLFPTATDTIPEYEQGFRAVFADSTSTSISIQVIYKLPEGASSADATTLAQAKANYAASLKKLNYTEGFVSGEKTYFSPNNQFEIQFSDFVDSNSLYDRFNIDISAVEAKDLDAWPAQQIADYFTLKGITGSLPEFPTTAEGVSYRFLTYDVEDGADPQAVILVYGAGKDYSGYQAVLEAGGYKLETQTSSAMTFIPSSGIPDRRVQVGVNRTGAIAIYVFPLEVDTTFPMAKVLAELGLESDPYPAIAGTFGDATYFEINVEFANESIYVYGNFDTSDAATACRTALAALFDADTTNWVKVGNGAYTNLNNTDLSVYFGVSSSNAKKVYVDFTKTRYYDQFPQAVVVERLNLNPAYSFLIPVPSFEASDWVIDVAYGSGFTQVTVSTEFTSAEDATAAAASYVTSMTTAGYKLVQDPWYTYANAIYARAVATGNELDIVFQF